jgi:hypothetical protein
MSEEDITEKLYAPAYWISGSAEGHEVQNDAPYRAAAEIDWLWAEVARLATERERLRTALRGLLGIRTALQDKSDESAEVK